MILPAVRRGTAGKVTRDSREILPAGKNTSESGVVLPAVRRGTAGKASSDSELGLPSQIQVANSISPAADAHQQRGSDTHMLATCTVAVFESKASSSNAGRMGFALFPVSAPPIRY